MKKVEYPIDKNKWHPSLIPGSVVLISTFNSIGEANIAPKSWIQMVSFNPPILMFSGTYGNTTEKNIIENNSFGVNVVDSSMVLKVSECINWFGKERIEKTGFTIFNASKINAPLIQDCKAHLECTLYDTKLLGSGFVIFGEIVYATIWDKILEEEKSKRYTLLDQALFLEDGLFSSINKPLMS